MLLDDLPIKEPEFHPCVKRVGDAHPVVLQAQTVPRSGVKPRPDPRHILGHPSTPTLAFTLVSLGSGWNCYAQFCVPIVAYPRRGEPWCGSVSQPQCSPVFLHPALPDVANRMRHFAAHHPSLRIAYPRWAKPWHGSASQPRRDASDWPGRKASGSPLTSWSRRSPRTKRTGRYHACPARPDPRHISRHHPPGPSIYPGQPGPRH
jgi:hypothetical protein